MVVTVTSALNFRCGFICAVQSFHFSEEGATLERDVVQSGRSSLLCLLDLLFDPQEGGRRFLWKIGKIPITQNGAVFTVASFPLLFPFLLKHE
jgi:hypothetical protein